VVRSANTTLKAYHELGLLDDAARSALTRDPMAYGMQASRRVLETITQYVHEQGLTKRRVGLDEIFAPSTMEL